MVGIPVITSNFPARRELIDHEVSGLVTEARDVPALARAIERLLQEPELADRLAAGLHRAAARYDVEEIVTDFLADLEAMGWR